MIAIPPEGSYACVTGCGALVTRPGLCEMCGVSQRRRHAAEQFAYAEASIPSSFGYAFRANEEFIRRATSPTKPKMAIVDLIDGVVAGTISRRDIYVFRGPSKRGKSSIACAAARPLIGSAGHAWTDSVPLPMRAPYAPLDPYVVRLAAGLRFVSALDLVVPRDRGDDAPAPAYGLALRAGLLILDDMGKELEAREDTAAATARAKATADVIDKRWNAGRPTWITTYLNPEQIATLYDGGIYRRLFHDERSRVFVWE
jgi:hypothetical protein